MNKKNEMSRGQKRVLSYYFTRLIVRMALLVIVFGTFYYFFAKRVGEPLDNIIKSYYLMITLIFLNPIIEFPKHPILQLCFFILPVTGISFLAQGLEKFGRYFFNPSELSKDRLSAELISLIPTIKDHTIIVGVGQLGFKTAELIRKEHDSVIIIDLKPRAYITEYFLEKGVPMVIDDATKKSSLEASGIKKAKSIIICTSNDAANLQIALCAQEINPNIKVIIRIFDSEFEEAVAVQFPFAVLNATDIAGNLFTAAALGANATNPVSIEGRLINSATLKIPSTSSLIGKTVEWLEDYYRINMIYVYRNKFAYMYPQKKETLKAGDTLAILSSPKELTRIIKEIEKDEAGADGKTQSRKFESMFDDHIVLIGLGQLGYCVARELVETTKKVIVIENKAKTEFTNKIQEFGIPIIHGDAVELDTLEKANIKRAATIMLTAQNDGLNLQIALKAISLNPGIQVIIQIFDNDFGDALRSQFGFCVLHGTAIAAPAFASTALNADITNPIPVDNKLFSIGRLTISSKAPINRKTIGEVERYYRLNIVLHKHNYQANFHPLNGQKLQSKDFIVAIGESEQLKKLAREN